MAKDNDINLDDLDNLDFQTLEDEDKKENFLKKKKKTLKGTPDEKTVRIGLKFTSAYQEDLLKYKNTLGATTFNGILYKLIELGKEQHKKQLQKILKDKENKRC